MPVAAAISAVGGIAGAGINAYSARSAADAASSAQMRGLETQRGMFMVAQNALSPFISSGTNLLPTLTNEATGGSGTFGETLKNLLTPGQSADVLATMPGFQFASKYGTMAATNALAARGLAGGPGVLGRAISDYNTGLTGQQYFNTVGALQNAYGGRVGALQGIASLGANSGGNLAGGAISSGNAMAGTFGNIGNSQASGIVGTGNALSGGLTSAANAYGTSSLINRLAPGGLYGNSNPTGFASNPWSSGNVGTADYWGAPA